MVIERACAGKYGDAGNDGDNESAKDKLSNRGNGIATALKNERKTLTLSVINAKGPPQGRPAASGPHSGAGSFLGAGLPRAAVYIDGFNFFHAVDELRTVDGLKENHLKWLDLWALSAHLVGKRRDLKRVVWCSAKHWETEKGERWTAYKDALVVTGVIIAEGHFTQVQPRQEKESDINLALHLMLDAIDDVFDIAFLVTADSDQAATAKLFRARFKGTKKLYTVSPPNVPHSQHIVTHADHKTGLSKAELEGCLLPAQVRGLNGRMIHRPKRYDPPPGWMSALQRKIALVAAAEAIAKG
jgi:uncharacterized LabA/DUF88 family protein